MDTLTAQAAPLLLVDLIPVLVPFAGLLGVVIGSFLNVVIYRVPAGLSVVSPASACPQCRTPIRARDNIPLVSWLLLRGKCRDCTEPISARYPNVEAATGVLFAMVAWWSLHHAPALTPVLLYLCAAGVALFMIDLDCFRLPDAIVLPSYGVVGVLLCVAGLVSGQWPVSTVVLSALVWWLTFVLPYYLTAKRGMGLGDVKLAPVLGAALGAVGWGASLVGLFAGFALGAVVGLAMMRFGSAHRKTKMPYGPFLLTGALFGLLLGTPVWHAYLSLVGL